MQSLLVKPYCIDDNPSHEKPNTKTTTNNISALPRVCPFISTIPRMTKHVHAPKLMSPNDLSCEINPFPRH